MEGYRTVGAYARAEFVERKSRFIGHIAPACTEAEALAFVERISREHRDATHNVYAYILREPEPGIRGLERFSDNGEPQGTAGVPVLGVLQKEGLTDVCVVVTRYFGGILLGGGGLVRAYSHGAKIAVDAAQVRHMCPCVRLLVPCDYSFYGKLTYLLPDFRARILSSDFGAEVCLELLLRADRLEAFSKALTEASNGQVSAETVEELWEDME